jgi:ribosome recycling factor
MAIHDEVMPKMSEVNKLKNDIMKKADSLAQAGEEEASTRLKALAEELEDAGSSMMVWMRQYKPADLNEEEVKAYLEEQKVKVEEVRTKINTRLEKARKELESWMEEQE